MIKRDLEPILLQDAKQLPIVAILGPRQSGKTTLARTVFKKHAYVSMEEPSTREAALEDPHGFLAQKKALF